VNFTVGPASLHGPGLQGSLVRRLLGKRRPEFKPQSGLYDCCVPVPEPRVEGNVENGT